MNNFDFPTNIKQIGTIGNGLRIYVEDYVCSYLQQYAEAGGYDERLAILVGRYITIDSQPVIFISGAILGKYCIEESAVMVFTDKSYEYIEEQMKTYFRGLEVVGWMQSQPGYGTFLNPNYANYHLKNFNKPYQVMFVIDPIEKLNSFYTTNNNELEETKGYFVYYEKNHNMHEYMIENKILKIISQKTTTKKPTAKKNIQEAFITTQEHDATENVEQLEEDAKPELISINKNTRKRTSSNQRGLNGQKRIVNMLVSMCSVMLLICFVLAAGLIRSEDRINGLEGELQTLSVAYKNILVSLQTAQDNIIPGEQGINSAVLIEEDGNNLLLALNDNSQQHEADEPKSEDENLYSEQTTYEDIIEPVSITQDLDIPENYIVQQGDSLLRISRMFYGTTDMVGSIMEANNMTDPDKIFYGKVLVLPR